MNKLKFKYSRLYFHESQEQEQEESPAARAIIHEIYENIVA